MPCRRGEGRRIRVKGSSTCQGPVVAEGYGGFQGLDTQYGRSIKNKEGGHGMRWGHLARGAQQRWASPAGGLSPFPMITGKPGKSLVSQGATWHSSKVPP